MICSAQAAKVGQDLAMKTTISATLKAARRRSSTMRKACTATMTLARRRPLHRTTRLVRVQILLLHGRRWSRQRYLRSSRQRGKQPRRSELPRFQSSPAEQAWSANRQRGPRFLALACTTGLTCRRMASTSRRRLRWTGRLSRCKCRGTSLLSIRRWQRVRRRHRHQGNEEHRDAIVQ